MLYFWSLLRIALTPFSSLWKDSLKPFSFERLPADIQNQIVCFLDPSIMWGVSKDFNRLVLALAYRIPSFNTLQWHPDLEVMTDICFNQGAEGDLAAIGHLLMITNSQLKESPAASRVLVGLFEKISLLTNRMPEEYINLVDSNYYKYAFIALITAEREDLVVKSMYLFERILSHILCRGCFETEMRKLYRCNRNAFATIFLPRHACVISYDLFLEMYLEEGNAEWMDATFSDQMLFYFIYNLESVKVVKEEHRSLLHARNASLKRKKFFQDRPIFFYLNDLLNSKNFQWTGIPTGLEYEKKAIWSALMQRKMFAEAEQVEVSNSIWNYKFNKDYIKFLLEREGKLPVDDGAIEEAVTLEAFGASSIDELVENIKFDYFEYYYHNPLRLIVRRGTFEQFKRYLDNCRSLSLNDLLDLLIAFKLDDQEAFFKYFDEGFKRLNQKIYLKSEFLRKLSHCPRALESILSPDSMITSLQELVQVDETWPQILAAKDEISCCLHFYKPLEFQNLTEMRRALQLKIPFIFKDGDNRSYNNDIYALELVILYAEGCGFDMRKIGHYSYEPGRASIDYAELIFNHAKMGPEKERRLQLTREIHEVIRYKGLVWASENS